MSEAEFFQAIGTGDQQRVAALLSGGIDPNSRDENGDSALSYALGVGEGAIATLLLDQGADINGGEGGSTPLQLALEAAEYELVERLIALGADPNRCAGDDEGTALHVVARGYRDTDFFELLLQAGADVNAPDDAGNTPLLALVAGIDFAEAEEVEQIGEIVQLLLANGADPALANQEGATPAAAVSSAIASQPLPALLKIRELLS